MSSSTTEHPDASGNSWEFVGGRVCLDFVNTLDPRDPLATETPREFLTTYAALIHWSQLVGLLTPQHADALRQAATHHPSKALKVLEQAHLLRETLYRLFSASIEARLPAASDLNTLQEAYARQLLHAQLVPEERHWKWDWQGRAREAALDAMLGPLLSSAIELLTSPELAHVKACPGLGDCGWLFLDSSKNGSRVWCSMESCGSRAKMRRLYARKRSRPAESHSST